MIPLDPTPNLIDQVYARILDGIVDRTLPPGHRIRQNELAEQLGVSRQPVSHALHLLHRQGLVAESGRQGLRSRSSIPCGFASSMKCAAPSMRWRRGSPPGASRPTPPARADLRRRCAPGAAIDRQDAAGAADRARRRFSPRDLPAFGQSRDRGNDRAAMAAYAPLDGDGAGRTGLSPERLGRTRNHRRAYSVRQCEGRGGRGAGACARRRTNDGRETERDGESGVGKAVIPGRGAASRPGIRDSGFALRAPRNDKNKTKGGTHETDPATDRRFQPRGLAVPARIVQPRGGRAAGARGRGHLRHPAPRGVAREERRAAHRLCRPSLQRGVRPARRPSAHDRSGGADLRREGLHAPVQDQRQIGLHRRRLAVAPGLRHLEARRRHAAAARHEHRDLPRRGDADQRPA